MTDTLLPDLTVALKNSLYDKLNPQQQEAILASWGPVLVVAGAGSGKTTVLTSRVAHLINLGETPESILAVTFTNKAANQMKDRLEALIGVSIAKYLSIGTFHSLCARWLRKQLSSYISPQGHQWKNNFVIYDETDSLSLIKDVITKLELDELLFVPKQVRHTISALKNEGYTAGKFASSAKEYKDLQIAEIFSAYQNSCAKNNALDFDDLILLTQELLEQNISFKQEMQERFKHILVDEFQDTNHTQYKLLRHFFPDSGANNKNNDVWQGRSLMAVGDVDQSIYSWRQADFRIFLGFQKDFPQGRVITLEENYRSTATILAAANSVIKNNNSRIEKILRCNSTQGSKVKVYGGSDPIDEAYFVVEEIKRLSLRGISLSDICILYRTNAQSRALEEVLVRSHLPYIMIGGTRFYDRAEIKDILAYLKLIYNPLDAQSFLRIVNTPKRGIGKTSIDHVLKFAEDNNLSLFEAAEQARIIPELGAKAAEKISAFNMLVNDWQNLAASTTISELLVSVLKQSKYIESLEEAELAKDELARGRLDNLNEFIAVAKEFEAIADEPSLEAFLTRVSLASDLDSLQEGQAAIKLMTLHAAKGLEFQNVFIMGLEEKLFPHSRTLDFPQALEEERRLMYVGITRAKERLFLTYAKRRMLFMSGEYNTMSYTRVSRFLQEISPELLAGFEPQEEEPKPFEQTHSQENKKNYFSTNTNSNFTSSKVISFRNPALAQAQPQPQPMNRTSVEGDGELKCDRFKINDQVMHLKFGVGKIVQVIGEGEKEIYNIEFQLAGKRLMDPRFAKLIKIE